jgi:transmembrane sensor
MPADLTADDLLLNDIFIEYCLDPNPVNTEKWETIVRLEHISAEVIAEARSMLTMLTPAIEKAEIEDEILKLRDTIYEKELRRRRTMSRVSVFAGLVVALGTIIFFTLKPSAGKNIKALVGQYQTVTGEQKRITLPDGSIIILNSNTSISYQEDYNVRDRKIYLSGDAFFKVAKDVSKPFSVISGSFSTTALGTSFYVNADSTEEFSVKLLEGKVKIKSDKIEETEYLDAGEELKCPKNKNSFVKQVYDTSYLNKWISGKIIFRTTPVKEVFNILQKWYGVEIVDARNSSSDISINGTYENVLLEDILKVISFSLHCQYRYEGNKIIIE